MTYDVFTTNLSKLKSYREQAILLKGELEDLFYIMTGVRGVGFDNIPTSFNPHLAEIKRLDLIEQYDDKMREYNSISMMVQTIESIYDRMPKEVKDMLKDVFIKKITFKKASAKYHYSDCGFWHMLKRETEKWL